VRAMPRAWIVDRVEVIADEAATLVRLGQKQFDPLRTVILDHPPQLDLKSESGSRGFAKATRTSPIQLDIRTNSSRPGYLVLSELFYPGWRARVDGEQVELERADSLLTALALPAGEHTISYRFDPQSIRIGGVITLGTTTLIAAILLIGAFRRRGGSAQATVEEFHAK